MRFPSPYRCLSSIILFAFLPSLSSAQSTSSDNSNPAEVSISGDNSSDTSLAERGPTPPQLNAEEMGDLLKVHQHYQAAIQSYAKVEHPSAAVWNKMGISYQMMFDLKNAERCYKKSLKLAPLSSIVLNNYATLEVTMGKFSAGERLYRRSLKLNPASAVVLKNLGTNLLMQRKYKEGNNLYMQALKIDPHIFDGWTGPKTNDLAPMQQLGVVDYSKARSCARAGLVNCAIKYLIRAFNEGATTVNKVNEEKDFAGLRGTSALTRLLAREQ